MIGVYTAQSKTDTETPILARAVFHNWQGGEPAPGWLSALARLHKGYSICWNPLQKPNFRSRETKASIRKKRLISRNEKQAPLFAEELTERSLQSDPEYYAAKTERDFMREEFIREYKNEYEEFMRIEGGSNGQT